MNISESLRQIRQEGLKGHTTYLNSNERNWLIDQYLEQLEEFGEEELIAEYQAGLKSAGNIELIDACIDFMPIIFELIPSREKLETYQPADWSKYTN